MNPEDNNNAPTNQTGSSTDGLSTPPTTSPPLAPAAQSAAPAPMTMPSSGKNRKNLLIIIVVAAVLLAAGIAYGVYAIISNTPENLLKSAVDNLSREKALAANIKLVTGTADNGVTFAGDVAFTADQSGGKNAEVLVGLGSDDKRVGLSALSLDGLLYLKLANAENLGPLLSSLSSETSPLASPAFASALKNVNGQWFELSKEEVQAFAQGSGSDAVAASPTPADIKKVLELYGQHPFIKSDKVYADEVVDGSNSAHFSIKVDYNEEAAFMQAVKDANLQSIKVTDDDIAKVKTTNPTVDATLEVWIARDSHKFKQLRINNTEKGNEGTITLTLKSQLPTFDKLETPAGAKPISQFITTLLGPSYGSQFDDSSMLQ